MTTYVDDAEVLASAVTGAWKPGLDNVFFCPGGYHEPEPCDCGHVGRWEHRWIYTWHASPGHKIGDKAARRYITDGLPPRYGDEGWWIIAGYDERCPGCGDIERFNLDAERLDCRNEHAEIVRLRVAAPRSEP